MTEPDLRFARAARNQALFRDVNARLVDLNATFEQLADGSGFVCECARMECIQEIDVTLADYQKVRANPLRFIVAPSNEHVFPDVEHIVERHDTYFVVEKVGAAARILERHSHHDG